MTRSDHIAFFQAGAVIVSLWDRGKLAVDGGLTDSGGWGAVTLAHCVDSPEAVEQSLRQAAAAGARITSPGRPRVWGGYSGIFTDLDGHAWEIMHNPAWVVRPDGATVLQPTRHSRP